MGGGGGGGGGRDYITLKLARRHESSDSCALIQAPIPEEPSTVDTQQGPTSLGPSISWSDHLHWMK